MCIRDRIAIAVALLAPLATAMGMPFPLGVGRIGAAGPSLVAWAWGINGYTSVLGSVLTIALSLAFGFQIVIWIGAGVYAVAFLVAPLVAVRPQEDALAVPALDEPSPQGT